MSLLIRSTTKQFRFRLLSKFLLRDQEIFSRQNASRRLSVLLRMTLSLRGGRCANNIVMACGIDGGGIETQECRLKKICVEGLSELFVIMQGLSTPETLPRPVTQEKQSEKATHVSKELFKRSLRQVQIIARLRKFQTVKCFFVAVECVR
jgi:hypothetical protein